MQSLIEKIKNVKATQAAYPAIVIVLIIVTASCFALSAKFFSTNLNAAFVVDESSAESVIARLDLRSYYLVANKLGIPTVETAPASPPVVPAPAPTPAPLPPDKKSLKIEILNSTPTKGLAASLAALIANAGFAAAKTGNQTPAQRETSLQVRQGLDAGLVSEIKNIIAQKYAVGDAQPLPDSSAYDVIIVIGIK